MTYIVSGGALNSYSLTHSGSKYYKLLHKLQTGALKSRDLTSRDLKTRHQIKQIAKG